MRDALVVADLASNRALAGKAEPGGTRASRDCRGRVRGRTSPYRIKLAAGAVYALSLNAGFAALGALWLFALSFVGPLRRTVPAAR